jgi:uncharacterized protein YkwD
MSLGESTKTISTHHRKNPQFHPHPHSHPTNNTADPIDIDTEFARQFAGDIHKIVNEERTRRGMEAFGRHIILESVARDIVTELVASHGRGHSSPSAYHGNIAQGTSLYKIHSTMMEDREGIARKNILSTKFGVFGMAVAKDREDGTIYMCQLFNKH